MEQGHIQSFTRSLRFRLIGYMLSLVILAAGSYCLCATVLDLGTTVTLIVVGAQSVILAIMIGSIAGSALSKPTRYLSQAILHISPSEHLVAAPNMEELTLGRELATNLTRQLYSFATVAQSIPQGAPQEQPNLLDQLPVAIIGIDEQGTVVTSNQKLRAIIEDVDLTDIKLDDVFSLHSEDEISIETWYADIKETALTDLKLWQKVEVTDKKHSKSLGYYDIAVSFNSHSATGIELMFALYDHSEAYNTEHDSLSFIALAVHELRTPLTSIRGYIEALEEDIKTEDYTELASYVQKMSASAQGLTSFVSNILNVAKINQGQLTLKLTEGNWNEILVQVVDSLRSRADAYGKEIELRMEPDLPLVAMDRMTVGEVITNLVDNAIKYSPDDKAKKIIIIGKINQEGLVETTVQDEGVGIPSSVLPHLFTKFYRNHRNQSQIGGTGLGLYLTKAIVTAHHGHIWVSSKEDQGSTFGFTLIPYDQLAKELTSTDNGGVTRSQHGWIKNHSMQRR